MCDNHGTHKRGRHKLPEDRPCTKCGKAAPEVDFRYSPNKQGIISRRPCCKQCDRKGQMIRQRGTDIPVQWCSICGTFGHTKAVCKESPRVGEHFCSTCKRFRLLSFFRVSRQRYDGIANKCNECDDKHSRKGATARYLAYGQEIHHRDKRWEKAVAYLVRMSKAIARERNLKFDIDTCYMMEILQDQDYKCYYTGKPMVFAVKSRENQDCLSIDRIDSTKGYIKGNVVFTRYKVNMMKRDKGLEEFLDMCREITEHFSRLDLPDTQVPKP